MISKSYHFWNYENLQFTFIKLLAHEKCFCKIVDYLSTKPNDGDCAFVRANRWFDPMANSMMTIQYCFHRLPYRNVSCSTKIDLNSLKKFFNCGVMNTFLMDYAVKYFFFFRFHIKSLCELQGNDLEIFNFLCVWP